MPDGRKRILGPFTGRKKRKAWNKTRVKYICRQKEDNIQLKQTRDHITKRNCQKKFYTVKVHFYNEQQQLLEDFANSYYKILKIVSPILLQKLVNGFAVCKRYSGTLLLVENVSHVFQNYVFQKGTALMLHKAYIFKLIWQPVQFVTCARVSFLIKLQASGLQLY